MNLTLPDLFVWLHHFITQEWWGWASIVLDIIINHFLKEVSL